jgi:hypothetical protein
MHWMITNRADVVAAALADKHYSRQTIGARQFTPPGRVLVLVLPDWSAVWATSWPDAQYVHREYPDAWICTLFRNESTIQSSILIREAVAATRWKYGQPPESGMITMIDAAKVACPIPGYCYRRAKFKHVGETKERGLLILRLTPARMPAPEAPKGVLAWEEAS